jgi:hypothetical protein
VIFSFLDTAIFVERKEIISVICVKSFSKETFLNVIFVEDYLLILIVILRVKVRNH